MSVARVIEIETNENVSSKTKGDRKRKERRKLPKTKDVCESVIEVEKKRKQKTSKDERPYKGYWRTTRKDAKQKLRIRKMFSGVYY